ncbi:MAG: 30S ribosomal protein S3 [Candidatus Saliniplasma sp.]
MAREKKFIQEKMNRVLLKEFLKERTERAGFGGCDVSRNPMGTRITLHIERPSLVIGRKGRTIRKLTSDVKEKFDFDNPQIEVQEVKVPELNPQIMAEKLAQSLERGWHFRRAGHSTVRRIMDSGARGCQIILSGKITGPRHRVEKFKDGHIKYCGEEKNKWMNEGYSAAKVKLGIIGVTVQIMDPKAKLPDEIEIIPPKKEEPEEEEPEEEEPEEEEPEEEEPEEEEPEEEEPEEEEPEEEEPEEEEPKEEEPEEEEPEEEEPKEEEPKEEEPKEEEPEEEEPEEEEPKETQEEVEEMGIEGSNEDHKESEDD